MLLLLEIYLHFISLWVALLISFGNFGKKFTVGDFREGQSGDTINKHNYVCHIWNTRGLLFHKYANLFASLGVDG